METRSKVKKYGIKILKKKLINVVKTKKNKYIVVMNLLRYIYITIKK